MRSSLQSRISSITLQTALMLGGDSHEPRREETEGTGARIDPRVEKERAPISPEEAMAELRKLFDDEDPPLESGRVR